MKDIIKHYGNDKVTIKWQASLCIHCGYCAKGLPEVFQPKERPWIKIEAAAPEKIRAQVEKCPSGALSLAE